MMLFVKMLGLILTAGLFTSCTKPPDLNLINEDLGIAIPTSHKVIKADHDPFGFGADQQIEYVFQFDSAAFKALTNSIEASTRFNFASQSEFKALPPREKLSILELLSQKKMSSYWIKSDTLYIYDGDRLFLNDRDRITLKASAKDVYLPNYDKLLKFQDGAPLILYQVQAVVDRTKRTLYYRYVHI